MDHVSSPFDWLSGSAHPGASGIAQHCLRGIYDKTSCPVCQVLFHKKLIFR